jgi:hypothetical protein
MLNPPAFQSLFLFLKISSSLSLSLALKLGKSWLARFCQIFGAHLSCLLLPPPQQDSASLCHILYIHNFY